LAALALVFPMVMLQQMLSSGAMGGGVSSAISRAIGAGQTDRAATLAMHATVIGGLAGVFFTVLFLVAGPMIYRTLGGQGAVLDGALLYSNTVFLGATGIWLTNTFASVVRGTGNMRVSSATLLGVAAAQICIGGALGLGLGPFPNLGLRGVALGQALAFTGGAIFFTWYLLSGRAKLDIRPGSVVYSKDMFADILKVGAIACLSPLQSVLSVLVMTGFVARFGTEALAGYGIGARLEFLLVPIAFAIGVASVPMVGMAIGADDVPRARRVAWTAGALAALATGLAGLGVFLMPELWARIFSTDPRVIASARSYLVVAGPAFGFFGLGLALYFSSQGSGKMLGPVLAQTVRLVTITVGGAAVVASGGDAAQFFSVVALALVLYGLASSYAVYSVPWGPKAKA
ncbi:MAG: MATE family efflux transporter, partial [Hyphomicrobiaceae bacterium]|nr:MATE family efflux transporter [Hyphomicrobiaceae bacterium]